MPEKEIAGKIMAKIGRKREVVSEKVLKKQYEAFDRKMNEMDRMTEEKGENEKTELVFEERNEKRAFKEKDRARSKKKV